MADEVVLEVSGLKAGYGQAELVLKGVSLTVRSHEIVCLVGPNGAGKSTVLKVLSGLLSPKAGKVMVNGQDVTGLPAHQLLDYGVAHVMQGHSVFPEMTVGDNVEMGGYKIRSKSLLRQRVGRVRELFPVVDERWMDLAGLLSGGQQKMVELARAMVLDPLVLLLDEPSCGLEPRAFKKVFEEIRALRELGKALLLVEQNVRSALQIADRGCVLDLGHIRMEGSGRDLLKNEQLAEVYLGGSSHVAGGERE